MNEHDNGGPAFPSSNNVRLGEYASNGHAGMTLRDYFAAKAMQAAIIAAASWGLRCSTDADPRIDTAIDALKEAIKQQGEPVAWRYRDLMNGGPWQLTTVSPTDWGTTLAIEYEPLFTHNGEQP